MNSLHVDEPLNTEIDVSDWRALGEEQLGTKPKQWLSRPNADPTSDYEAWLWKARTFNHDSEGKTYPKGDDWAEVVGAEVGRRLGIPTAEVRLARRDDQLGVISRDMLRSNSDLVLIHGNELLEDVGISVATTNDRAGYNVNAVRRSLVESGPPLRDPSLHDAWDWFVGYLMLDVVIGNTDRHHENWAVISDGFGRRNLAPSFDHASSLGFAINDTERHERLTTADSQRSVEAFAGRAKTKFEGRPTTLAVLLDGIASTATEATNEWIDRLGSADRLPDAVEIVPDERISQVSREFAHRLLIANVRRTVSHLSVQ